MPSALAKPLSPLPKGRHLLPWLVEHRGKHDSERVCMSYQANGAYVDITYADFAHAVNVAAEGFSKSAVGRRTVSTDAARTVAVLANSGPAYMVTLYALHKCGITPVLISPRNAREAIVNLLKLTECVAIIADRTWRAEAAASAALWEERELALVDLPTPPLAGSASEDNFLTFQLETEAEWYRPALYLHTSGSTGLPKPVPWSYSFIFHQGYYPQDFVDRYSGCTALVTLPLYHGSGVALSRASFLWLGWHILFLDNHKPLTADDIAASCCQKTAAITPDIVIGAPSVIEDIAKLEGGWDVLRSRTFWFFVGAPVPRHLGDLLVGEQIHFLSMLGSTEIGQMNVLEPLNRAAEDWQYHQFRPDLDVVLEARGDGPDGAPFELIVLANDDWSPGTINVNVHGTKGYSTSDLYHRHPSNPLLFKHGGRADDVVVLANGEKTLSRGIESKVESHPLVKACLVFGTGRTQNGLLVWPAAGQEMDPSTDRAATRAFIDSIWSAIEEANATSPTHSQIWRQMVLVTKPEKTPALTDKGSIRRKQTLQQYEGEIDDIYLELDRAMGQEDIKLPAVQTAETLAQFCQDVCQSQLGRAPDLEADVFANGMDSLKSIGVTKKLTAALRNGNDVLTLPSTFVYRFVSPQEMGQALFSLISTGSVEDEGASAIKHQEEIHQLIAKYTDHLPLPSTSMTTLAADDSQQQQGGAVILTGSTGSLGSFILGELLESNAIGPIFCLNRPGKTDSFSRQMVSYKERGLDTASLQEAKNRGQLFFYDVDLMAVDFGLSPHLFQTLRETVSVIIHNAWTLNFNARLASFETPHISGVRALIDFALSSTREHPPKVAFTSSIASVGAFSSGGRAVPEESIADPSVCLQQGYAASKFVAERVLQVAHEQRALPYACFRVGQICGDGQSGVWNTTDHVPITLRGCQDVGAVPQDWLPAVSWVPVDQVARTVVDISLNRQQGHGVFHICNPWATKWADLLPSVQQHLSYGNNGEPLRNVTFRQWVQMVRDAEPDASENPAKKLVGFFENNMAGNGIRCQLDLTRSKSLSSSLAKLPPFSAQDLVKSLDYWKSLGFLR